MVVGVAGVNDQQAVEFALLLASVRCAVDLTFAGVIDVVGEITDVRGDCAVITKPDGLPCLISARMLLDAYASGDVRIAIERTS